MDVTDASIVDSDRRVDLNPNHDWHFRDTSVDPMLSQRLLVLCMIGKLEGHTTSDAVAATLQRIAVPMHDMTPEENCVTWLKLGVRVLQQHGIVPHMDVDAIFEDVLRQAMNRLERANFDRDQAVDYVGRPADICFKRDWL